MAAPWIHRQKWRCEIQWPGRPPSSDLGDGRRRRASSDVAMRARGRWPPPATGAIVGNGDAAARRAVPGRLGIVGCDDARARLKTASGCPRRQVLHAVQGGRNRAGDQGGKPRGLMCSSATLAGFFGLSDASGRRGRCSICCCFFSDVLLLLVLLLVARPVAKLAMRATFCLIQRPLHFQNSAYGRISRGSP